MCLSVVTFFQPHHLKMTRACQSKPRNLCSIELSPSSSNRFRCLTWRTSTSLKWKIIPLPYLSSTTLSNLPSGTLPWNRLVEVPSSSCLNKPRCLTMSLRPGLDFSHPLGFSREDSIWLLTMSPSSSQSRHVSPLSMKDTTKDSMKSRSVKSSRTPSSWLNMEPREPTELVGSDGTWLLKNILLNKEKPAKKLTCLSTSPEPTAPRSKCQINHFSKSSKREEPSIYHLNSAPWLESLLKSERTKEPWLILDRVFSKALMKESPQSKVWVRPSLTLKRLRNGISKSLSSQIKSKQRSSRDLQSLILLPKVQANLWTTQAYLERLSINQSVSRNGLFSALSKMSLTENISKTSSTVYPNKMASTSLLSLLISFPSTTEPTKKTSSLPLTITSTTQLNPI